MPVYRVPPDVIVSDEEVKRMLKCCNNDLERLAICIGWLCGPRPSELIQISYDDILWNESEQKLIITVKSLKRGNQGSFEVRDRTLKFEFCPETEQAFYIDFIISFLKEYPNIERVQPLFPDDDGKQPRSRMWYLRVINRTSKQALNYPLSPYHFRHSSITWLARNGMTVDQLKYFKGAKSLHSVEPYLHATPTIVSSGIKRSRNAFGETFGFKPRLSEKKPVAEKENLKSIFKPTLVQLDEDDEDEQS